MALRPFHRRELRYKKFVKINNKLTLNKKRLAVKAGRLAGLAAASSRAGLGGTRANVDLLGGGGGGKSEPLDIPGSARLGEPKVRPPKAAVP